MDKKRFVDLVFFGALIAVLRALVDLLGVTAGVWTYKLHLLPLSPSIFIMGWTIIPLTLMLAAQYSENWKQFIIRAAMGSAFIAFIVEPILIQLDILQYMRWNYLLEFTVLYAKAIIARVAFHLVVQVQEKARANNPSPLKSTILQPALKPLPNKENEDE